MQNEYKELWRQELLNWQQKWSVRTNNKLQADDILSELAKQMKNTRKLNIATADNRKRIIRNQLNPIAVNYNQLANGWDSDDEYDVNVEKQNESKDEYLPYPDDSDSDGVEQWNDDNNDEDETKGVANEKTKDAIDNLITSPVIDGLLCQATLTEYG